MKITYIEHSGFLLETAEADFLFDYYKGGIPQRDKAKPLLVFVSHRHSDHYNPAVFDLLKEYPNTRYVLSKDVPIKREILRMKEQGLDLSAAVSVVEKQRTQNVPMPGGESLSVETLQSTDEGVAFLVECGERTIYHAGDLNLWVWEEESRQYNENMTRKYFAQLERLKGRRMDVAFVPLDPRQEKDAFGGLESFLEYTDVGEVFPMHCWGDYGIIHEFLRRHPEYEGKVRRVEYAGQSFYTKRTP